MAYPNGSGSDLPDREAGYLCSPALRQSRRGCLLPSGRAGSAAPDPALARAECIAREGMNRQRHVIDRARAHREGKRYGAFFEGHRAYGQGLRLDECPYASPRRKRASPERAVQKACLVWLRRQGAIVAVTDAGAAYRAGAFYGDAIPAGWPDITGLLPNGRFIGVECKAKGGRQSTAQKRIEREIRKRNGLYVLARSVEDLAKGIADARRG